MKNSLMKTTLLSTAFSAALLTASPAVQILVNGNFDANVDDWAADDGSFISRDGRGGVDPNDLNTTGGGMLDTGNTAIYVFQDFILAADSLITFGTYYTASDGNTGAGYAAIHATGGTEAELGRGITVNPVEVANNAAGRFRPWLLSDSSNAGSSTGGAALSLVAGTYQFRAYMNNNTRMDGAFVNTAPIPEPSSLALLSLGAISLLTIRRRK
jgi:hypothetical protein